MNMATEASTESLAVRARTLVGLSYGGFKDVRGPVHFGTPPEAITKLHVGLVGLGNAGSL